MNQTVDSRRAYSKDPNCTLNDYTKNISESIFSPGNHEELRGIKMNNPYYKKSPGQAMYTHVKGLAGTVSGGIGDKRFTVTGMKAKTSRNMRP